MLYNLLNWIEVGAGAVILVFVFTTKFCLFKMVFFLGQGVSGLDAFLAMSHSGSVVPGSVVPGLVVPGLFIPGLVVPGSVGVPKICVKVCKNKMLSSKSLVHYKSV
jgi:hypothetical protein